MNKSTGMNFWQIAITYVAVIVGAGFASGREIWQYVAIHGSKGIVGIVIIGIGFMVLGVMVALIARMLRSTEMGEIVIPSDAKSLHKLMKLLMSLVLFLGLANMSSAAGAMLNQEFAIPSFIGSLATVILTVLTVLLGFEKMSKIFSKISPFLIAFVICIALYTIYTNGIKLGVDEFGNDLHPLASNLFVSSSMFVAYNIITTVSILGTAAYKARDTRHAVLGAIIGGLIMMLLSLILFFMLLTDVNSSNELSLPILLFAENASKIAKVACFVIMGIAIYSAASGMFYGFSTLFSDNKTKWIKVSVGGCVAFLISLIGFKVFIKNVLPFIGIFGFIIVLLLIINFTKVVLVNIITTQEKNRFNFPEGIVNVTTGHGASALLFIGEEKTALVDCSMAYRGDELVAKIKSVLEGRKLDYFFASHTHYDHIGALPYLKKEWKDLVVFGAEHGQNVLKRPGAHKVIKELGEVAAKMYDLSKVGTIITQGLGIDVVLKDGDKVDLGGMTFTAIETKGHTKCCMTYYVEPMGVMLLSESAGVMERKGMAHPAILYSYEEAMKAFDKCEKLNPKRIIISHYGIVPESYNKKLWKLLRKVATDERNEIIEAFRSGMSENEIYEMMKDKYWYEGRSIEQPIDAFEINMRHTIALYREPALGSAR